MIASDVAICQAACQDRLASDEGVARTADHEKPSKASSLTAHLVWSRKTPAQVSTGKAIDMKIMSGRLMDRS